MNNHTKIIVGMSGGVDSTVSAFLLKQQYSDIEAVFMKNWEQDDTDDYCPASEDMADAQCMAAEMRIPFHPVNFAKQYWDKVFSIFLSEYEAGRTPNPDILCNKEIKFKVFLDYALSLTDKNSSHELKIATGHYARIKKTGNEYFLLKGIDKSKDQSYFLHALGQRALSHALFPLGDIEKKRVREIAESNDFAVYDKKDSTGICFIGEKKFNAFLSRFLKTQKGEMVTPEGIFMGEHQGLIHYTLGQRKGLGIGGSNQYPSNGEPWFVADKDLVNNQLIVVQGKQHPLLYSQGLECQQLTWISGKAPKFPLQCTAKTRYRQPDQSCTITRTLDHQRLEVIFEDMQFAVTPGQSVVFYQGDICLGGGVIDARIAE